MIEQGEVRPGHILLDAFFVSHVDLYAQHRLQWQVTYVHIEQYSAVGFIINCEFKEISKLMFEICFVEFIAKKYVK